MTQTEQYQLSISDEARRKQIEFEGDLGWYYWEEIKRLMKLGIDKCIEEKKKWNSLFGKYAG